VSVANDIYLSVSARTDVGMCRRGNEDCFLVADLSTGNTGLVPEVSNHRVGELGSLLVVSDGMGGAVAGEIASDLSVNHVRENVLRNAHIANVSDRLRFAVESANHAVWQYAQDNRQFAGMGATMTAVLCHENRAYIAQVGDSRAYLIRGNRIKQLTKDQSLVQLLMDAGAIKPEEANQVPNNVILQALGTRAEVIVAMTSVDLCRDDYILLCSDGLSNKVVDDEMRGHVLQANGDIGTACRSLIEMANARGGEDNITVVVGRFDGKALESASERSSITGSMHALTPDDLMRIGSAQLDRPYSPSPSASADNGGIAAGTPYVTLQPPPGDPNVITRVGFPALPPEPDDDEDVVTPNQSFAPTPPAAAPMAPAPQQAAAPAPANQPAPSGAANKLLLVFGVLLILLGLLATAGLLVYWFFIRQTL
jgi:serine/threonine protein phosphatase PrpC